MRKIRFIFINIFTISGTLQFLMLHFISLVFSLNSFLFFSFMAITGEQGSEFESRSLKTSEAKAQKSHTAFMNTFCSKLCWCQIPSNISYLKIFVWLFFKAIFVLYRILDFSPQPQDFK